MKTLKIFAASLLATMAVSCGSAQSSVEQQAQEAMVSGLIDSTRFTFTARSMTPMGGRNISLTSNYTLKVTPDTIKAYLPFFGRAYVAPYPGEEGGIKFTSTRFEYKKTEKKGVYDITIKTADASQYYVLQLSVGKGGYTSLQVLQNDKQPISFYGIVE